MLTTWEIQVMKWKTIGLKGKISIKPLTAYSYLNQFSIDPNNQLYLFAEDFNNGFLCSQTPAFSTYSHDKAPEVFVGTGDLVP